MPFELPIIIRNFQALYATPYSEDVLRGENIYVCQFCMYPTCHDDVYRIHQVINYCNRKYSNLFSKIVNFATPLETRSIERKSFLSLR